MAQFLGHKFQRYKHLHKTPNNEPSLLGEHQIVGKGKIVLRQEFMKDGALKPWSEFLLVPDVRELEPFLMSFSEKKRYFHEVFFIWQKVRPYFDVDFLRSRLNGRHAEIILPTIIDAIKKVFFEKFGIRLDDGEFCVTSSSGEVLHNYKYSYHIILPHFFTTIQDMREIMTYLYFKLPEDFQPKKENPTGFVDNSVYKKTQSMRLLHCCKVNSPRTKKLVSHKFSFIDTIISYVPPNCHFVTFRKPLSRKEEQSGTRLTHRLLEMLEERELRQFGCPPCISVWWRKVPVSKPVSRCIKCNTKYDPFLPEEEFGYGKFTCKKPECGVWSSPSVKRSVKQPCYVCGDFAFPDLIGPVPKNSQRKTRSKHFCADCESGECRRRRIPHHPHISTGSTISGLSSSSFETSKTDARLSVDSDEFVYDSD